MHSKTKVYIYGYIVIVNTSRLLYTLQFRSYGLQKNCTYLISTRLFQRYLIVLNFMDLKRQVNITPKFSSGDGLQSAYIYLCANNYYPTHISITRNLKIRVVYQFLMWYFTLREEYRLSIFENRIMRRIFVRKRDANGEWRRLYIEELHTLYRLLKITRAIKSRRLKWADHVARMEVGRSTFKILTGKHT